MSDDNHSTTPAAVTQLLAQFTQCFEQQHLVRLTLSKYKGATVGLEKLTIRPVQLKQQAMLSFVYRYQTKDITKNYDLAQSVAAISQQLGEGFKHANLVSTTAEHQLMFNKKNQARLLHRTTDKNHSANEQLAVQAAHNRNKKRYVNQQQPFLQALGVTDQQAQVIPAMSRKWKQINKFVEIFSGALQQTNIAEQARINVVDFGSGKGYLTFALHDYMKQQLGKQAHVTGVELRDELVQFCNGVAHGIDAPEVQFFQGDVRSFEPDAVDVMIALHACDIATDFALHTGIRLNAAIIMCAPCCHKQIRPQLQSPQVLQPMMKYGVHLGQEAEMLTDSLRALLLEAHGYDTKVFEFVALEHTSKNKMILAVKKQKTAQQTAEILQQIAQLKQFYGVQAHCLEQLLQDDVRAANL